MRVLAYIEPHPIRNVYIEFAEAGRRLSRALLAAAEVGGIEFRVFANGAVADDLSSALPQLAPQLLRPTAAETAAFEAFDRTWSEHAIAVWLQLIEGTGPVSGLYASVVRRIHESFPFDLVLLWSENGAVRDAARALGAAAVHAELGPTRAPFPPTIYLDPAGTNGNAAVTRVPLNVIERVAALPPETWITPAARKRSAARGALESGVLWPSPQVAELMPPRPFAFVPLQLADDLNTLSHASYKTPSEFLAHVVPTLLAEGLDVVIKRHPAVTLRPHNVSMESRALARARALGEGVSVLPMGIDAPDTLALVAQAQTVCSINSSVGFEAMLIGKRCWLLGSAVYDLHGRIRARGLQLAASEEQRSWDAQAISFLMGHYLVPSEDVLSGEALLLALQLIQREHARGGELGERFWSEWVECMAFGWRALGHAQRMPAGTPRALALAGDLSEMLTATLQHDAEQLRIDALLPGQLVQYHALCERDTFRGFIEQLDRDGDSIRVAGWSLEIERLVPPVLLLVAAGDELLACAPVELPRDDVINHYPGATNRRCGFSFQFSVQAGAQLAELRLLLVSERNSVQEVAWRLGRMSA